MPHIRYEHPVRYSIGCSHLPAEQVFAYVREYLDVDYVHVTDTGIKVVYGPGIPAEYYKGKTTTEAFQEFFSENRRFWLSQILDGNERIDQWGRLRRELNKYSDCVCSTRALTLLADIMSDRSLAEGELSCQLTAHVDKGFWRFTASMPGILAVSDSAFTPTAALESLHRCMYHEVLKAEVRAYEELNTAVRYYNSFHVSIKA